MKKELYVTKFGLLGGRLCKKINSAHKSNVLYSSKSMYQFPRYSISALLRKITVNVSAAMRSFSYAESVLKFVSGFLNFPVWNHSFTSSMI